MPPRLRLLLLVLVVVVAAVFWARSRRAVPAPAGRLRGGVAPEVVAQVEALESTRAAWARTHYAPELLAERHEAVITRLWDELRATTNAAAFFAALNFQRISWPDPGPATELGGQVRRQEGSATTVLTFGPAEWRVLVEQLQTSGWRLDGSEWRHVAFRPGREGAVSTFAFELHLERPAAELRRILRGRLEITWEPLADEAAEPAFRLLRVVKLELLERRGPPRFELVLRDAPVAPARGSFSDPLLIQDLDGDGLDDVVLAGAGSRYRNRGAGFTAGSLLSRSGPPIHAALLADLDQDGFTDLVLADTTGVFLVRGAPLGEFAAAPVPLFVAELPNPYTFSAADVDGDGDLDLWLVQYKVPFRFGQMPTPYYDARDGFPAFLLRNDGAGRFTDITGAAGLEPTRRRRSYASSLADLDGDGDADLVNVPDFGAVDVFLNDGRGKFTEVSDRLGERRLFGMGHALADFDDDGRMDLFAVGMNSATAARLDSLGLSEPGLPAHAAARAAMTYGNRVWLGRAGARWERAPWNDAVAAAGWAWGVAAFDADNDGDLDLYLANGHRTRGSVNDLDPEFWLHDIHVATSGPDPVRDLYFGNKSNRHYGHGGSYGGHHRNALFQNDGADGWHGVAWLHGVALPEDCRNVAAVDLDGDGRLELVVVTEELWPREQRELRIYRNHGESGHWLAVRLREEGGGITPWGARVTLEAGGRKQTRWFVTGDSYRTQSPSVAHFGLGTLDRAEAIEVRWANGTVKRLDRPAVDRVHAVGGR